MENLTDVEVAWLAGIFEAEGYCGIKSGKAIAVEIQMTDLDIMERIQTLTGLGQVRQAPVRVVGRKPVYRWTLNSVSAVSFLTKILPWLGQRRSTKAREVISNWTTVRPSAKWYDAECIHGHSFDPPNKRLAAGGCRMCANEANKRYRARKKANSGI